MSTRDRLSFRPGPAPDRTRLAGASALVALFLCAVALYAFTRTAWAPAPPTGIFVEVRGDVPRPGLYAVAPPTAAAALERAGADPDGLELPDAPLTEGQIVRVRNGAVTVQAPGQPLLFALPIDVNQAGAEAFTAIPGVGRRTAEALVADREARGPFATVHELLRVPGLGEAQLERLRPFVVASAPGPMDLNAATAAQLETLPGVGPVLAARIVVDRADHGPFTRVEDLLRVPGVGPATLERLADRVEIKP